MSEETPQCRYGDVVYIVPPASSAKYSIAVEAFMSIASNDNDRTILMTVAAVKHLMKANMDANAVHAKRPEDKLKLVRVFRYRDTIKAMIVFIGMYAKKGTCRKATSTEMALLPNRLPENAEPIPNIERYI